MQFNSNVTSPQFNNTLITGQFSIKGNKTKDKTVKFSDITLAPSESTTKIRKEAGFITRIIQTIFGTKTYTNEETQVREKIADCNKNLKDIRKKIVSLQKEIRNLDTTIGSENELNTTRSQKLAELKNFRSEWSVVKANIKNLDASLNHSTLSNVKELKKLHKLEHQINTQFKEINKHLPGTGGYELNLIKTRVESAFAHASLVASGLERGESTHAHAQLVRVCKDALKEMDALARDQPTDSYIGNSVQEYSAEINKFLFENGEIKTLPLTLNRHNVHTMQLIGDPTSVNPQSHSSDALGFNSDTVKRDLINHLPKMKVNEMSSKNSSLSGSPVFENLDAVRKIRDTEEGFECNYDPENKVSGFATATGIHSLEDKDLMKEHQNNDSFGFSRGKGWELSIVADGSGVNPQARLAADLAKKTFYDSMMTQIDQKKITTVKDVGRAVLKAMDEAQKKACTAEDLTTFTMGFTFESGGKKIAMVAGVGDSPAAVRRADGSVELLAPDIKKYTPAAKDPGGQLGSKENEEAPDIRNLFMTLVTLEEGDTLVIGSDGMFDNLDPEMSNITPLEAFKELQKEGRTEGLNEPMKNETWENGYEENQNFISGLRLLTSGYNALQARGTLVTTIESVIKVMPLVAHSIANLPTDDILFPDQELNELQDDLITLSDAMKTGNQEAVQQAWDKVGNHTGLLNTLKETKDSGIYDAGLRNVHINFMKRHQNLQRIINRSHEMKLEQLWGKDNITVSDMNRAVNTFCQELTAVSRAYCRQHQGREAKIVGTDVVVDGENKKVMGKLDDCTCLSMRVGSRVEDRNVI